MLVEGLQSYLAVNAGLRNLLGTVATRSDKSTGIFPMLAPESPQIPYLVFQQVSGDSDEVMEGTNATQTVRFRFSCYGSSYKEAKTLAKYFKFAMQSMLGLTPTGLVFVQNTSMKMEADDSEPLERAILFSTHVDYELVYTDNDVS